MEKVPEVKAKNEDLEARSRRNNIRITRIPETTAMGKVEDFVETLLRDIFGSSLLMLFIVERTHWSLAPKPPVGGTPRPILARILNYRDRDTILRVAREMGQITHQGSQISSFFPDFTPAVQSARREFVPTKKILRQAGITYTLLYPAKLKVNHKGNQHFFTDAKSALKYVKHAAGSKRQAKTSGRTEGKLSDND